jgi:hypothetical protein
MAARSSSVDSVGCVVRCASADSSARWTTTQTRHRRVRTRVHDVSHHTKPERGHGHTQQHAIRTRRRSRGRDDVTHGALDARCEVELKFTVVPTTVNSRDQLSFWRSTCVLLGRSALYIRRSTARTSAISLRMVLAVVCHLRVDATAVAVTARVDAATRIDSNLSQTFLFCAHTDAVLLCVSLASRTFARCNDGAND